MTDKIKAPSKNSPLSERILWASKVLKAMRYGHKITLGQTEGSNIEDDGEQYCIAEGKDGRASICLVMYKRVPGGAPEEVLADSEMTMGQFIDFLATRVSFEELFLRGCECVLTDEKRRKR